MVASRTMVFPPRCCGIPGGPGVAQGRDGYPCGLLSGRPGEDSVVAVRVQVRRGIPAPSLFSRVVGAACQPAVVGRRDRARTDPEPHSLSARWMAPAALPAYHPRLIIPSRRRMYGGDGRAGPPWLALPGLAERGVFDVTRTSTHRRTLARPAATGDREPPGGVDPMSEWRIDGRPDWPWRQLPPAWCQPRLHGVRT